MSVPTDDEKLIDWRAVFRGALVGLSILVPVSALEAILDRNIDTFQDSGWIYPLFVLILFGYALGGFAAGKLVPGAALSNGALAGLGAFVLWVPVRIVIWLIRDENRGLFTGHSPALRPGQIFGHLVIAAGLGLFGGYMATRAEALGRAKRGS